MSGGCTITGSIYTFGTVGTSGGNATNPIVVGKSIVARGGVSMDSNGVTIGSLCVPADGASCGQIASGGAVNLKHGWHRDNRRDGDGFNNPSISSNWKRPDLTDCGRGGGRTRTDVHASPELLAEWWGRGRHGLWDDDVGRARRSHDLGLAVHETDMPSRRFGALSGATTPLILDYSGTGCSATQVRRPTITLSGGNVPHDAVFLVAPGKTMKVEITAVSPIHRARRNSCSSSTRIRTRATARPTAASRAATVSTSEAPCRSRRTSCSTPHAA